MITLAANIAALAAALHLPKAIIWIAYFGNYAGIGYCGRKLYDSWKDYKKGPSEQAKTPEGGNKKKKETEIERKVRIEKETEQLKLEKQQNEIDANNLVNVTAEPRPYKGIKPPANGLLWGYNAQYKPVWGDFTNYIVTGTTGNGKTRKLMVMLLNFLANQQGKVYIVDLKETDYKHFIGCKGVEMYISDLERTAEAVKAFEAEHNRRIELINKGYTDEQGINRPYIDIADYNNRNPEQAEKEYMLLIDEYADISDTYKDRNGKPIGVYADIIRLARKCRATGGRIVLGTQRPSADVVIGTLKNNTQLIGMGCLNEINSKIVLDVGGCEKLKPREALLYIDGKLEKIFSYSLDDKKLVEYTDKLK